MIGYTVRTDYEGIARLILESKSEGRISMGRPRLRWLGDVGKGIWEMKGKNWRQISVNRAKWASVMSDAKDLRGP